MMDPDALPATWLAALRDIAANRSGLYLGVAVLPGGSATAHGLAAIGAAELLPGGRHVTLSPWGAQHLLGVEAYEFDEGREPVWMLSTVVAEDEAVGGRAFVSLGFDRGVSRDPAWFARRPAEEAEDETPPEPVADDYGNVVALFGGVPLFRESDIKREARRRRKEARKAAKLTKRRSA